MGLVFSNSGGAGIYNSDDSDNSGDDHGFLSSADRCSQAVGSVEGGERFEYNSPESRLLFRHLRKSNFSDALALLRCNNDTELAKARDSAGRTPLHACIRNYRRDPPPQLVDRLLKLYPGAASATDGDGNTVLHYSCDACSNQTLFRTILESYPHAALVTNARGELPLHMADSKFAATELARRFPETVSVADASGKTPLFLFADLLVRHLTVAQGAVLPRSFGPDSIDPGVVFHKQCPPFSAISLPDVWDAVATMVQSTARGTVPLLHAAVRYGLCPTVYVQMVCRMKPEVARRRDVWGDLPLHAAARELMAPGRVPPLPRGAKGEVGDSGENNEKENDDEDNSVTDDVDDTDGGSESDSDGEEPEVTDMVQPPFRRWEARRQTDDLHRSRSTRRGHRRGTDLAEDAIREILDAYPSAARERDVMGRLPLQCASAGKGMTWGGGARLMLISYPGAIHVGGWAKKRSPEALGGAAATDEEEQSQARRKRKRPVPDGALRAASKSVLQKPLYSSCNGSQQLTEPNLNSDNSGDRLDDRLLPRILSKVGRDCTLGTMFELLSGRPDLVRGGVALRRSGRKRRKRS